MMNRKCISLTICKPWMMGFLLVFCSRLLVSQAQELPPEVLRYDMQIWFCTTLRC
jgi:hypothetical protein